MSISKNRKNILKSHDFSKIYDPTEAIKLLKAEIEELKIINKGIEK